MGGDALGGDADTCHDHRIAVGPHAERAGVQRLGIVHREDRNVVEVGLHPLPHAAELDGVPRAVDVAPLRDKWLVSCADVSVAYAWSHLGVGLREEFAVP